MKKNVYIYIVFPLQQNFFNLKEYIFSCFMYVYMYVLYEFKICYV